MALASLLLSFPAKAESIVLAIHSYHSQLPWTRGLAEGLERGFESGPHEVEIFHEFLDAKRLPALDHGVAFLETLAEKYRERPPDLIVVSDDPGFRLARDQRHWFFPSTPLIYLGINQIDPEMLSLENATGVFELHDTVQTALGALTQTGQSGLIVLNDSTETGNANLRGIRQLQERDDTPEPLLVLTDLTPESLGQEFGSLSRDLPILVLGQLRDGGQDGALLSFQETAEILRQRVPNPLYTESVTFLGHGVIGGKILDAPHHAFQAVNLAQRVLNQGTADGIPPITVPKDQWTFDHEALEHFGIDASLLPEGSLIVNATPSFYEQNRGIVWIAVAAFSGAVLINLLLAEVLRRRSAEQKILRDNEKRYQDLAEAASVLFWEIDSGMHFTYVSDDTRALLGNEHSLIGQPLDRFAATNPKLSFDLRTFLRSFRLREPVQDFTFTVRQSNDAVQVFTLNARPIVSKSGDFEGYRGIQRVITKEHELAETLAHQATYDWLTGLVNRYEFNRRLEERLENPDPSGSVLGYLDLDQFKIVNDTSGHLVGDQLLVELSVLLQQQIRETDILGRLGGDEFGLILSPCSLEEATTICERLIAVTKAYRLEREGRAFSVGCSIGVVPILDDSTSITELLSRADLACYTAKDMGRGRVFVDAPGEVGLDATKSAMTHVANVRNYIAQNQFFLARQSIRELAPSSDSQEHFEVLLRFKDDQGLIISPGDFIPAMERYGVIGLIDRWVLQTVLANERTLPSGNLIAINISGISLGDERFHQDVVDLLKNSGVCPSQLCFEITETAAITQLDDAKMFIRSLQSLGAKFALDDFGSGLATFDYLRNLHVDFLKIDGSLVRSITRDENDLAIVRFANDLAHMRGIKTIAEFVEDEETLECLKGLGIDYAQGFAIDRPTPWSLSSQELAEPQDEVTANSSNV